MLRFSIMKRPQLQRMATARIPTSQGEFQLHLYRTDQDDQEHLALTLGQIAGIPKLLTRIHSECFTGDVLGSLRCDCGDQLQGALEQIAQEGAGILLYLPQEGRGIGLKGKLQAYNLQDNGYDTVDANLALGHQADARDYTIAAQILHDLGVSSIQLLTNNPLKIEQLTQYDVQVADRVPLLPVVTGENAGYLRTKMLKMRHLFDMEQLPMPAFSTPSIPNHLLAQRPFVTLSYAQSLNGMLTAQQGRPTPLSNSTSLQFTHQLRATHDGILVGIGTVLADDPRLSVRLVTGKNPQPIVLDSQLRLPLSAKLLRGKGSVWLLTTQSAPIEREKALTTAGARVIRLPANGTEQVALDAGMTWLWQNGVSSLMVEGGAKVIASFLTAQLVDRLVVTISPRLMGGLNSAGDLPVPLPLLQNVQSQQLDTDLLLWGDLVWETKQS